MNAKQELLAEITQEVRSSRNPQHHALKMVADANQALNKYDEALKKPLSSLADRSPSNKRVSFAEVKQTTINQTELNELPKVTSSSVQDLRVTIQRGSKQTTSNVVKQSTSNVAKQSTSNVSKPKQVKTLEHQSITSKPKVKDTPQVQSAQQTPIFQQKKQLEEEPESRASHKTCRHGRSHHSSHRTTTSEDKSNSVLLMSQLQEHLLTIRKLDMNQRFLEQSLQAQEEENTRLRQDMEQTAALHVSEEQKRFTQQQQVRQETYAMKEQLQTQNLKIVELSHNESFLKRHTESLLVQLQQLQAKELQSEDKYAKVRDQVDQLKLKLMDKEGQCSRFEQQNQHLTQDVALFQTQCRDAQTQVRVLIAEVTQLENDKTKFMSELAIMKQDKHEDLHSLRDKLASLKKDSDAMLVQHKKDLAHVDAIKHERDQFKHDCEQLRVGLAETEDLRNRMKLKCADNEQLQSDNDKLKQKIRKDPNGVLSDLKNMHLQVHENKVVNSVAREQDMLHEIQKLDRENRQLQEDHDKVHHDNQKLVKQLQENDVYIGELKALFAKERTMLEQQLDSRTKQPQLQSSNQKQTPPERGSPTQHLAKRIQLSHPQQHMNMHTYDQLMMKRIVITTKEFTSRYPLKAYHNHTGNLHTIYLTCTIIISQSDQLLLIYGS